jgi:hypothetical protein
LHFCFAAIFHNINFDHVRDHRDVIRPWTGVAFLTVWHSDGQRLAENTPRGICLRRDIQQSRRGFLDDQGYFPITEGLQLRAKVNQGCIEVEQTPNLPGLSHHIRAIQAQAGFHIRRIDARQNLASLRAHPLLNKYLNNLPGYF